MVKNKTNSKTENRISKRQEIGGGIIMSIIFAALPFWKLIFIPFSIIGFSIGILLIVSAYSRESLCKSFIVPALIIILCASSIFLYQHFSKQTFATLNELNNPFIQNKDIYISDLARKDVRVYNKTFDNCHFYGPAIIGAEGSFTARNCKFIAAVPDPNEDFFIETKRDFILGVVIFVDCDFRNCTFHKIAFIGPHDFIINIKDQFRKGGWNLQ